jgi:hypothetical protein
MNLIFTIVAAFPLGYFIARRQHAIFTYLIVGSFVFSLQSVALLLTWMSGGEGLGGASGFGDSPTGSFPIHYSNGEVVAYGVVNAIITLAGVGLVMLGAKLRARRLAHSPSSVVDVAR